MKGKERLKLESVYLSGFKSFNRDGQTLKLGDVTVLIGANGSGKSNLVSFFKMLGYLITGSFQNHIAENGTAESLLFYGSKLTPALNGKVNFRSSISTASYEFMLSKAARDTLIFNEETISSHITNKYDNPFDNVLEPQAGRYESGFTRRSNESSNEARIQTFIYSLLERINVYQFHDTSANSNLRSNAHIEDNRYLRSDGGNLSAFLYTIKKNNFKHYEKICRYIGKVMPQFKEFDLRPSVHNENFVSLNWIDNSAERYLFGAHQISDGSLRFMCLATLLLQPKETLPSVIVLDEPELGLHPSAVALLAAMVRSASKHCQVILATQSPSLVDEFEAKELVIINNKKEANKNHSELAYLDEVKLKDWLEEYSLSELWDKNVLHGRP